MNISSLFKSCVSQTSFQLDFQFHLFCFIIVIRMNGSLPVKYGFRLGQDDRVAALKEEISKLAGDIPAAQMLVVDVYPQCPIRVSFT